MHFRGYGLSEAKFYLVKTIKIRIHLIMLTLFCLVANIGHTDLLHTAVS